MRTRTWTRVNGPVTLLLAALITASAGLLLSAAPSRAQGPVHTVNVEIILDSSGSMGASIGSETRMEIAKRVLKRIVALIPERDGVNVGFRIYGHRGTNDQAGRAESCRSSELVVPIDGVNKAALDRQIDAARPTGWTPLAYSLGRAGRDFPWATDGVVNAVVLVTDGLETCGGDPCAVSGALNASNVALTTHVIGFAVPRPERSSLQCIADNGGGLLLGAQDADELYDALFRILSDLEVVSDTGEIEIEAFAGFWPDALAICEGRVSDSNPDGLPVIVDLGTDNRAEAPVGICRVAWRNPSGTTSRVEVEVVADEVTWIRGSVIGFPQGAGEAYRVTDQSGIVIWDAPFETGDRIWVLPGLNRIELVDRVGDPILTDADLATLPGSVLTLHVGTEP